jgi:hypothetical protein
VRGPDGSTEREHLESVERQTGKRPPSLDGPPLPPDGEHVWRWFVALSGGRGGNGFGPNPIGWVDLAAWISLTGIIVRPAELEAIMAVDRAWMEVQSKPKT